MIGNYFLHFLISNMSKQTYKNVPYGYLREIETKIVLQTGAKLIAVKRCGDQTVFIFTSATVTPAAPRRCCRRRYAWSILAPRNVKERQSNAVEVVNVSVIVLTVCRWREEL